MTSLAYFCRPAKNWEGYYVSKSCVHNVLDRNLADIFMYLSFILSLLWILYVNIIVGSVVIRRNVEFICWYFKGFSQKRNILWGSYPLSEAYSELFKMEFLQKNRSLCNIFMMMSGLGENCDSRVYTGGLSITSEEMWFSNVLNVSRENVVELQL